MPQTVQDIMTKDPRTIQGSDTITEAARTMRDSDIGTVLVLKEDNSLCGIVTDRDITIRVVAEKSDPNIVTVEQICSHHIVTVAPQDKVEKAEKLMRENAIRRIAVLDGDRPVGVVSIDDLARAHQPDSPLAEISAKARRIADKAAQTARIKLETRKTNKTKHVTTD